MFLQQNLENFQGCEIHRAWNISRGIAVKHSGGDPSPFFYVYFLGVSLPYVIRKLQKLDILQILFIGNRPLCPSCSALERLTHEELWVTDASSAIEAHFHVYSWHPSCRFEKGPRLIKSARRWRCHFLAFILSKISCRIKLHSWASIREARHNAEKFPNGFFLLLSGVSLRLHQLGRSQHETEHKKWG
jgi:hypothetical protein